MVEFRLDVSIGLNLGVVIAAIAAWYVTYDLMYPYPNEAEFGPFLDALKPCDDRPSACVCSAPGCTAIPSRELRPHVVTQESSSEGAISRAIMALNKLNANVLIIESDYLHAELSGVLGLSVDIEVLYHARENVLDYRCRCRSPLFGVLPDRNITGALMAEFLHSYVRAERHGKRLKRPHLTARQHQETPR